MRKLLLTCRLSPGDILVMTALVRDIALTCGNNISVSVKTSCSELWQNNPHIVPLEKDTDEVKLEYSASISNSHYRLKKKHFLTSYYDSFKQQTGYAIPVLYPWPDYHLSEEEKNVPLVSGRYWVVISGGKSDFVTKHWVYKRYQQVVNLLHDTGLYFVQLGALGTTREYYHYHPALENTLCLLGMTNLRDMARIIYHAEGVICPITVAMHFAAAFHKPCVVIAGGREEWWWESYVAGLGNFGTSIREDVRTSHKYLHTQGLLPCCKDRGCWKDQLTGEKSKCEQICSTSGQILPKCMSMITVNHVFKAVMSYYKDRILPPIGEPKHVGLIDGKPHVLPSNYESPHKQSALLVAINTPEPQLLLPPTGYLIKQPFQS